MTDPDEKDGTGVDPLTQDARIRDRAHSLWEEEGRPEGRALDHWLAAERNALGESAAHPDDIDRAAGPTHGKEDFGGHDAETEGSAAAGVGSQRYAAGGAPEQAASDEPEVGEDRVRPASPKGRAGGRSRGKR